MNNPEPKTQPKKTKVLPNAMADADTWNAVFPHLERGVELVKAEHREKERDEVLAPVMLMVDRFVGQAKAYVDPPAPIDGVS